MHCIYSFVSGFFFTQHHIFEVHWGLLVAISNSFLLLYYNWFYAYAIILLFVDILLSGLLQKMLLCTSAYMSWYFYVNISLEYTSWSKFSMYTICICLVFLYTAKWLYKMLLPTLTILNIWCYSFNFSHSDEAYSGITLWFKFAFPSWLGLPWWLRQ